MKRPLVAIALLATAALVAPVLRADVKTTEKSVMKLEGMMGAIFNRMAGGADGITSSVAVKGNRLARMNSETGQGQIIDLTEQKVYNVDSKKKEYQVMTFAEMKAQMEKAKADMAKQQEQMKPEDKQAVQDAARQLEFDVEVKSTGQTKTLGGQNTRESVVTITMRQAGKKLEEGGGMVLTNNVWLAPRNAALDEVAEFYMKFFKAVYGDLFAGIDMQQMNALSAMLPGVGTLMQRMAEEGRKLQGTPMLTTSVLESVKSAEQMAAAPQQSSGGGGGLGGMLAGRMMRGRGQTQQRTTTLTTSREILSIASTASAEDVAIPAGFKEKK